MGGDHYSTATPPPAPIPHIQLSFSVTMDEHDEQQQGIAQERAVVIDEPSVHAGMQRTMDAAGSEVEPPADVEVICYVSAGVYHHTLSCSVLEYRTGSLI